MKTFTFPLLATAGLLALTLLPSSAAAKAVADLVPSEKRRAVVVLAQQLTRAAEPVPVPAALPQPFNPPGFDQPDPEELRANAAVAAATAAKSGVPVTAGGAEQPAQQSGDREILESLAARLIASGTMMDRSGATLLVIGKNRFEVGARFTVTFNAQDYELELVAIDRTTFTLRYHSTEITRPIKAGKFQ